MIRLLREPSPTYRYDSEGNLIGIKAEDGTAQNLAYSGTDLTEQQLPNGDEYTYTYVQRSGVSTHQIASVSDSHGVSATYSYDGYGNAVTAGISASGTSETITSAATYTDQGRYLSQITDALGNHVSYSTNTSTGLLQSMTDPKGTVTSYTYDADERISSIGASAASVSYTYNSRRELQKIESEGSAYHFTYDAYGNLLQVKAGNSSGSTTKTLRSYTYGSRNGKILSQTYGDGTSESYSYDLQERLSGVSLNGTGRFSYSYNDEGQLSGMTDSAQNITTSYVYDRIGRLSAETAVYPQQTLGISYTYDGQGRLSARNYTLGSTNLNYSAVYLANSDRIGTFHLPYGDLLFSYDAFERRSSESIRSGNTVLNSRSYRYLTPESGKTSMIVDQVTLGVSGTYYTYTYDANGNITAIQKNGNAYRSYTYDALNQLTSETANGTTTYYTYDASGNITGSYKMQNNQRVNLSTNQYTNAWGDLLTSHNGHTITYDNAGNPLTYYNDSSYTLSWGDGNRLKRVVTGRKTTDYSYTEGGIRVKKKVGSATTKYYLDGSRIVREDRNGTVLDYFFDESGEVIGFRMNGNDYYYGKNLQGDVVELYQNGSVIAVYEYDAWGKLLSIKNAAGTNITTGSTYQSHAGRMNPIRYRSYYYDDETGFYYLNSRYYDPKVGRFISQDTVAILAANPGGLTDKNLYTYCDNNPICRIDYDGDLWDTVFDIVSLCFSIAEVAVNPTDPWAWAGLAGDIIDIVPFVTGVGELTKTVGATVRITNALDNTVDTISIVKATDFTDDAADIVKMLDRSSGFTKSTRELGQQIHQGYKTGYEFVEDMTKEAGKGKNRIDFLDDAHKIIYELKPNNPRGIRTGIRQLQRYNKALGGGYTLYLELY